MPSSLSEAPYSDEVLPFRGGEWGSTVPHKQLSSTWKPQEWGMSVFQQLPKISGRNMRILSSHRADRELSLSLWSVFSQIIAWPCKRRHILNVGHFVMTCGGHHIMSGSWECMRRQQEKADVFWSIYEKKIRQAHIWIRM